MSTFTISVDLRQAREALNDLQREKLHVAANILKNTAGLYRGNKSHLPLWAAGVVTHGQPKSRLFEIGATHEARKLRKTDKHLTTLDHLHRVTATAEYVLTRASALTVTEIEDILLQRAITMRTTRTENNHHLKVALEKCTDNDDWQELYNVAGVTYELESPWVLG